MFTVFSLYGYVVVPLSPSPAVAVEAAEVDGFGEMFGGDGGTAGKVGDSAGHLEDAVVGTGGESQPVHSDLHELVTRLVDGAILVQQLGVNLCVTMDIGARPIAFGLNITCTDHPFAHA